MGNGDRAVVPVLFDIQPAGGYGHVGGGVRPDHRGWHGDVLHQLRHQRPATVLPPDRRTAVVADSLDDGGHDVGYLNIIST